MGGGGDLYYNCNTQNILRDVIHVLRLCQIPYKNLLIHLLIEERPLKTIPCLRCYYGNDNMLERAYGQLRTNQNRKYCGVRIK